MLSILGRRCRHAYLHSSKVIRMNNRHRSLTTATALKEPPKSEESSSSSSLSIQLAGAAAIMLGLWATGDIWGGKTPKPLNEEDCQSKKCADLLPGTVESNGGSIKRVKQTNRLPLGILSSSGIKHGELEGTMWIDDSGDFYQQKYWNDEAAYEMTADAAKAIRDASWELHAMCLEAVDLVVGNMKLILCLRFAERFDVCAVV